jgi:uncharacterized membrane protein YvlD (DUF360 family)
LYMVSSIVKGIYLDSFWSALLASIIISILSMIINWIFADR